MDVEVDFTVIGAGIVGLAVAEALSRRTRGASIAVLERHTRFGQETSSHNSEVVYAGLYYRERPLKRRYCIRGREMLYAFCEENRVPFRRCGKMVAATDPAEIGELERLFADAHAAGVEVQEIDPAACRDRMHNPRVVAALWSPSSGMSTVTS